MTRIQFETWQEYIIKHGDDDFQIVNFSARDRAQLADKMRAVLDGTRGPLTDREIGNWYPGGAVV